MAEPDLGLAKATAAQPTAVEEWSIKTEFVVLTVSPETADNSGSTVVDANAVDRWQTVLAGTTLVVMLKFDDGLTGITDPVIQCFGRGTSTTADQSSSMAKDDGGDPVAHKLFDVNGNHELTLTTDATNDVHDTVFRYTDPIEVDMDGASEVLVAIKTALAGTGTVNTSTLMVKAK